MVHDVVPWPVSEVFDATSIDTTSHEPIKAGTYEAVITASEIKANRANTGKGLNLIGYCWGIKIANVIFMP